LEANTVNCSLIRSYLQEHAAGTLPAYKAGWVVQHLAGCPDCTARLEEYHQEAEAIKAAAQAEAAEAAKVGRRRRRGRPPRNRIEPTGPDTAQTGDSRPEVAAAVPPEPALIPRASRRAALAEAVTPPHEESVPVQRPVPRTLQFATGALLVMVVAAAAYFFLLYRIGQ
jgi:predicted  nucleic acid-binding Zn-ribbon protein